MSKYNKNGTIDTEINHPKFGLIPCTVSKDDPETAHIFEQLKDIAEPYTPPPPPTDEELKAIKLKQFEQAVQSHLDTTARAKGYDDINSIAKYLVEGNQFYAECYAMSIWCAEVWAYCYEQVDIFTGTVEEFILTLPKFEG